MLGRSVEGALHKRSNLANQDALAWLPGEGIGPPVALAVADGHGSPKSFRSAVGARLAVETATEVLFDFVKKHREATNLPAAKRAAEDFLPRLLARRWKEQVHHDLGGRPFCAEEWGCLVAKEGERARQAVENNPLLAYGATTLAVALADSFLLYLQLGDGDILAVAPTGEVDRPLAADERLIGDETTSLCSEGAEHEFRIAFQPLAMSAPALILVSTDGYAKSFREEQGFRKVGSDILEIARGRGLVAVEVELEGWLARSSDQGSGDDITVGLLCRLDALAPAKDPGAANQSERPDQPDLGGQPGGRPESAGDGAGHSHREQGGN